MNDFALGRPAGSDDFLRDGGRMGALMRAHDWSTSPLGPPDTWPPILRTVAGIVLNARQPMLVAWGPELAFLYNDDYAPIFGAKHPDALGRPFADVWADIWDQIKPLVERTLAGEASFHEDLLIPMERHGHREDAWFSFSYTPVRDENGAVAGMLCAAIETTGKVLAQQRLADEALRQRRLFEQAPGFICIMRGPEHVFEFVNDAHRRLFGSDDWVGRTVRDAFPDIAGQGFYELLDQVYATGERYVGSRIPARYRVSPEAPTEERFLDFVYAPVLDESGRVTGVFCEGFDVTAAHRAQDALRESEARFQLALEAASAVGTWDWDILNDRVYADERFAKLYSVDPAHAASGAPIGEFLGGIHPDDRDSAGAAIQAAIDTAGEFQAEYRLRQEDGTVHWVLARGRVYYSDVDGRPARFPGVAVDITDRKREEDHRNALMELSDRFRDLEDPADIAFAAAEVLGQTMDVSRAGYAAVDHEAETLHIDRDWNAAGVRTLAGVLQLRDTGSFVDSLKGNEVTAVADVRKDDRTANAAAALEGRNARSFVNVPVVERDRLVGLLFVNHAYVRDWSAADLALLRDFADRTRTAVERSRDKVALRNSETQLRQANETLESLVAERTTERNRLWRLSKDLLVSAASDGTLMAVNGAWTELLGWDEHELVGSTFMQFAHPEDLERTLAAFAGIFDAPLTTPYEYRLRCKDGEYRWFAWTGAYEDGRVFANGRHTTAEHEQASALASAQEALRQSQKMEAVGQLTGGIAHDFNNMLAVVIGSLDLLGRRVGGSDARARRYIDAATDGARRAALLTQRLLAFSRQQPLRPEPIDANKLVTGMADLLRGSLGSDIRLETVLAGGHWRTHADPNQLENVLLNLAVNARDAMPDGGKLTIETQNTHLDARYAAAHLGVPAGQYVLIAVTDTGSGMPEEVIAKAFDPFFTTKEVGKGTGLGLSQVYGFVKQSGGHVKIYSEPDQGTTVKIYLPRYIITDGETPGDDADNDMPLGEWDEVVLVVEDEPAVRQFSVDALSELGYRVLEADGATTALRLVDNHPEIALLFTDVVMPDVNGRKLADEAQSRRPDLKVLFTTGYTRNAVVHNGVLDAGVELIGKPFTIEELAAKVREVLDAPATQPDG